MLSVMGSVMSVGARPRVAAGFVVLAAMLSTGACTRAASQPDGPSPEVRVDDDRSPCARLCDRLGECDVPEFIGVPTCTRDCEDDPRQREGPCRAPRLAYEDCVAALSCPDVRGAREAAGDESGPCAAERRAVIACEPDDGPPFIYFQF